MHEYGDASVIRADEVPQPTPGPGEVLVRVAATAFNPSEVGVRLGFLRVELPHTLGWDVSGTRVDTGEPVLGWLDGGAAAQYAVAPESRIVPAPKTIPLVNAAAMPVAGLTAWQAVFDHARIEPGQRVLITGGSGGVGRFAVQLARHAGATVLAPRRGDPYPEGPVDVVLHFAPAPLGDLPESALVVSATVRDPRATHFVMRFDAGQLTELVSLVDAGVVLVVVDAVRPLADLVELHAHPKSGRIVLVA
jgi:NADPH:quinone reductase-like Zn-dependent oxidoreductase